MMPALTIRTPSYNQFVRAAIIGGYVFTAAAVGAAIGWSPIFAVLLLAMFAGVLLVVDARYRVAFLVFGGLATLQSSDELDLVKIGYLLGAGVAFAAALLNCLRIKTLPAYQLFRPLWRISFLLFLLVGLSFVVAVAHKTPVVAWLRDVVPYLLFASIPIFALDAQSSTSKSPLLPMFVVAGTLTAASFAVEWLNRRQLAELPLDRLALPSFLLPAALFSYAVAGGLQGRNHRAMWVALSILILSLLLISATRSTLLLSFAPLAIVFVVKGNVVRRLLRLGLFSGIAVLMVSILVSYLANFAGVDTAKMADRLQSIVQVFDDPWSDPSFIERASQTETAWRVFVSNLSFGAGPGYLYDWSTVSGGYRGTFAAVDSPLLFPAKFGLVGIILLVVIVLVFIVFLRGLIHHIGPTVPCTALVGYTTIVGAQMMIGSPFHDKGVSFGLLFLLALSLYEKEGREH